MELLNEWLPIGTTVGEIGRGLLVGVVFSMIVVIAETWSRTLNPPVEWSRKVVHTGLIFTASFFPWIFDSYYAPAISYVFLWCFMRVGKNLNALQGLFKTKRKTKGDEFFPPSFYALYLICYNQPIYYFTAGIILSFSDTIAAIVGEQWGKHKYSVQEDLKSIEGTIAHLVLTFIIVFAIFWGYAGVGLPETLLLGLLIGMASSSAEAVGPYGSDNLIIPAYIVFLCFQYFNAPIDVLVEQNIAFLILLPIIGIPAYLSEAMGVGGLLVAHLVLYTMYSVGGLAWLIPLLFMCFAFFLVYGILRRTSTRGDIHDHTIHVASAFIAMLIPSIVVITYYIAGNYWEFSDREMSWIYAIYIASVAFAGANAVSWTISYLKNLPRDAASAYLIANVISILVALLGVYFVDSSQITIPLVILIVFGQGCLNTYLVTKSSMKTNGGPEES